MIDLVGEYTKHITEQITQKNIRYAIKGFILAANVSNEVIKKLYPTYTDEMIDEIRKAINKA